MAIKEFIKKLLFTRKNQEEKTEDIILFKKSTRQKIKLLKEVLLNHLLYWILVIIVVLSWVIFKKQVISFSKDPNLGRGLANPSVPVATLPTSVVVEEPAPFDIFEPTGVENYRLATIEAKPVIELETYMPIFSDYANSRAKLMGKIVKLKFREGNTAFYKKTNDLILNLENELMLLREKFADILEKYNMFPERDRLLVEYNRLLNKKFTIEYNRHLDEKLDEDVRGGFQYNYKVKSLNIKNTNQKQKISPKFDYPFTQDMLDINDDLEDIESHNFGNYVFTSKNFTARKKFLELFKHTETILIEKKSLNGKSVPPETLIFLKNMINEIDVNLTQNLEINANTTIFLADDSVPTVTFINRPQLNDREEENGFENGFKEPVKLKIRNY